VAGGQAIGVKPGEFFDVVSDGTNLKFKNLGHIGTYWDYGGSSVPNWVSACTVPPYLNCDGTTFSAATYPALSIILGSTTLPDSRGFFRLTNNQGTGRVTTAGGALDGNTNRATGGAQSTTLGTSNLPAYTPTVASNTLTVPIQGSYYAAGTAINTAAALGVNNSAAVNLPVAGGIVLNAQGGVSQVMTNIPPGYVGGLTLIRSA